MLRQLSFSSTMSNWKKNYSDVRIIDQSASGLWEVVSDNHFGVCMSWRVVVIESQSKLDYKMGYLVVRGLDTKRVLLDEIAVLLIENPAVSYDR